MTATAKTRGHSVFWDGYGWRYADDGSVIAAQDRPCASCGLLPTQEGHDACLGTLSGVSNACCGHGHTDDAYIMLDDGKCIRGADVAIYLSFRSVTETL